jgi:hypothetical protein
VSLKNILFGLAACALTALVAVPAFSKAPPADPYPPSISAASDATLLQIGVSSFKGGRLEPYDLTLDQPFDRMQKEYTLTVDSGPRTSKVMYISPVAYSPEASCTVNGSPTPFGIPFKADSVSGIGSSVQQIAATRANTTTMRPAVSKGSGNEKTSATTAIMSARAIYAFMQLCRGRPRHLWAG